MSDTIPSSIDDAPREILAPVSVDELISQGRAPVKAQFLVPAAPKVAVEAVTGGAHPGGRGAAAAKKSRNQVKREKREERTGAGLLCLSFIHGTCKFGDTCRRNHDVTAFLAQKDPELPGRCPFESTGKCNYGVTCRWLSKHKTHDEFTQQHLDALKEATAVKTGDANGGGGDEGCEAAAEDTTEVPKGDGTVPTTTVELPISDNIDAEVNFISYELQTQLRKSVDIYPRSSAVLKELGCQVSKRRQFKDKHKVKKQKTVEGSDAAPAEVKIYDVQRSADGTGFDKELPIRVEEKTRIDFRDKLYLAPLTTVGNLPFRRLCKALGADVTCSEMAMATNLLQGHKSEWALLKRHPSEDLFGVQICGGYPDAVAQTAEMLDNNISLDFLDLNCGCPIDLVCNKGAGSTLLTKLERLEQVVRAASRSISCPFTFKVRKGYNDNNDIAHTFLPRAAEWGACAVTLHGRTRQQRYSRRADWDYIARCSKAVAPTGLQLIGNGDVFSYSEYKERMGDGTPLPPDGDPTKRPRKPPRRRKGSSRASSRPMSAMSKAMPEDPALEEMAAIALVGQGLQDVTYEVIDEEGEAEDMEEDEGEVHQDVSSQVIEETEEEAAAEDVEENEDRDGEVEVEAQQEGTVEVVDEKAEAENLEENASEGGDGDIEAEQDIAYEIVDVVPETEDKDDNERRDRALEAVVKNIPEEARAAADAMAAASWEVAALARYRFDIEDVQGTQRRPTRRELAEKEARESEVAKLKGGKDAEVAKSEVGDEVDPGALGKTEVIRPPPPAAKSGSLLGHLPEVPAKGGGGDALGGKELEVNWKDVLPGEMGELAQRAQMRAAARKKRQQKKKKQAESALSPPSDDEDDKQQTQQPPNPAPATDTKSHARSKAQGIFAELGLGVPERPSEKRSRLKAADLAAEHALASVEALGDAAFEPAQDAAGGEDRVVAEAKEAVESTETAIVETGRSQDGSWGDVWKKPLLFEPAADGGLKPEEVEARELAKKLLAGGESSSLEEKHAEAMRLLELLQNSRSAFRVGKPSKDKEKRFAKGDIVLYRQHDGRIRRVEVVDVTEEEEEVKYSIELDASVRTTTADRLSHIPQGFEGVVDEAELRAETEVDARKKLEAFMDWDWCPSLAVSGDKPAPRAGHVIVTDGMAGVMFGGASEHGDFHQDTWEFCGESLRWKLADCLGDEPGRRAYATLSTVYPYQFTTCRLMLFGGWNGEDCTNALHVLEGIESVAKEPMVWKAPSTTGVEPKPRCMHSACLVVGGIGAERFFHGQVVDVHGNSRPQELPVQELIIFGGWVSVGVSLFQGMALEEMESGGEFLNDMCALDIDKLEWRRITPRGTFLPEPRAAHSACVTGRRMLVFGGQSQYEPVNELLEFQLDLCIWRRVQLRGSNPSPRSGHCCLMIDHGKRMLVFGGFDGEIALHDLYVLDTSTFIWTQIDLPGGHPLARSGAACAMMGPTRMYMMGGYCKAGFVGDMHALDMMKRQVHKVKLSGGPYSTSLFKLRITFAEGVEPESVPLAIQWYRATDKGRFERIKGATGMAYLPNADDMMTSLGVACLPCTADLGKALGSAYFASSKRVKIDPELSMLVKHLIANAYAEFKIRLLSAKGSSRQLMLVLTPTSIKIKLDGTTQIKDGYNHTFKIILSIHRLNTFVLQLNESTVLPMAVEHVYERDLVALTARGFWAIAMSRPQASAKPAVPAADQLAAAYAKRKRKEEKAAMKRDIWKDHPGTQQPAPGLQGSLSSLQQDLKNIGRSKKIAPGVIPEEGSVSMEPIVTPSVWLREDPGTSGTVGPLTNTAETKSARKKKQQGQTRGWVIE